MNNYREKNGLYTCVYERKRGILFYTRVLSIIYFLNFVGHQDAIPSNYLSYQREGYLVVSISPNNMWPIVLGYRVPILTKNLSSDLYTKEILTALILLCSHLSKY